MEVINLVDDGSIAKAGTLVVKKVISDKLKLSTKVTISQEHTGGTLTTTLKASFDGANFFTIAAATDGDLTAITTGVAAWDTFDVLGSAQAVEVTFTEGDVAACTAIDATMTLR